MKQKTRNIALIIVWIIFLGIYSYYIFFSSNSLEFWEKETLLALLVVAAFLNIRRGIKNNKDFTLSKDSVIIEQTFSKEKIYNLKNISNWNEYNYHLFGFKTGSKLILELNDGNSIELNKVNSKEYEKLLKYLNENLHCEK